jgi:hypothetical protein
MSHSNPTEAEIREYLMDLRDSGITNMFGAGPYLQDRFDLTREEARDALINWMESFYQK